MSYAPGYDPVRSRPDAALVAEAAVVGAAVSRSAPAHALALIARGALA